MKQKKIRKKEGEEKRWWNKMLFSRKIKYIKNNLNQFLNNNNHNYVDDLKLNALKRNVKYVFYFFILKFISIR